MSTIDPTHYFSAPGLSSDAMLKMTKIKLEQIDNSEIHMFIERGMRGGICIATQKHCIANNEECDNYNPSQQRIEIK